MIERRATYEPKQLVTYAWKQSGKKRLRSQDWEDLTQQAWLLICLGKTDLQVIRTLGAYIRFLRWQWGRNKYIFLTGSLEGRVSKGYEPTGREWIYFGNRECQTRWKEQEKANRRNGLCGCGRQPTPDYKTCQQCRDRSRRRRKRSLKSGTVTRQQADSKNQRQKELRKRFLAQGLCGICGGERAEGDDQLCERHRQAAREKQRRHRERRKARQTALD